MASKLKNRQDLPQYFGAQDVEAAANGGVIVQVPSSLTTRDKVGILIHSIEFLPEGVKTGAVPFVPTTGSADGMKMGITQLYNGGVVPEFNDPGVIDCAYKIAYNWTQVGHVEMNTFPLRFVFESPKLAHPAALYWFFQGIAQAAALTVNFRMEYSYRDLSDSEYQDIIQTIVLQNSL